MIVFVGIFALFLYAILLSVLLYQYGKIKQEEPVSGEWPFVSIIVPVRNEEKHIERLLKSISKNIEEGLSFEVLVINDHSTDQTSSIARNFIERNFSVRCHDLAEGIQGKKAAITYGVSLAKGDLIICTDGDSIVTHQWVQCHLQSFMCGNQLSFGSVELINEKSALSIDVLNMELSGLVAVGGATLQMGRPSMINGCNYSFSKAAFSEVGGFDGNQEIPSGDDEFLLRKIHGLYPSKISFIISDRAKVTTEPPKSLSEMIQQRRRWASKWKIHKDVFSKLLPVLVFVCYATMLLGMIYAFVLFPTIGLIMFMTKYVIDLVFVKKVRGKVSIINFTFLQIIYPFYVVFFAIASNFGSYQWRGRVHKI